MNTIEDIIEWIKNYENPSENIEKFAYELGEMIKDMDYTASNGGAAVGYAGATGSYEKINTGIYLTVDNITAGSNGEYSFVNNGVNILYNDEFKDILFDAVGEDADRIMGGNWDDGTRSKYSFGDAVALNDIVSENFMSTNARGDVILLIMNTVRIAEYRGDNYIIKIKKLKGIFGRNSLCYLQCILNEKIVEIVINCVAVIHYSLGVTALA